MNALQHGNPHSELFIQNQQATDTCSLERKVWVILAADPRSQHVFFVPCDSHGLQLLNKDIPDIKLVEKAFSKVVNAMRNPKRQLGLSREHQIRLYGKKKALIASNILRWATQVDLWNRYWPTKLLALRSYAVDDQAGFKKRRGEKDTILVVLLDTEFWVNFEELLTILWLIHNEEKMSESDSATIAMVYQRWLDVAHGLRAEIPHSQFGRVIECFWDTKYQNQRAKQFNLLI